MFDPRVSWRFSHVCRFGRKVTLFVTMAVQTVFSLVQVMSVSWVMFCVLYFIVGLGQISNYVAAFVLGTGSMYYYVHYVWMALGISREVM